MDEYTLARQTASLCLDCYRSLGCPMIRRRAYTRHLYHFNSNSMRGGTGWPNLIRWARSSWFSVRSKSPLRLPSYRSERTGPSGKLRERISSRVELVLYALSGTEEPSDKYSVSPAHSLSPLALASVIAFVDTNASNSKPMSARSQAADNRENFLKMFEAVRLRWIFPADQ
jgi:hypothetical protein